MTDSLSLSRTRQIADSRRAECRQLYAVVLGLEGLFGLLLLLWPGAILSDPESVARVMGVVAIAVTLIQVPILLDPEKYRLIVLLAVAARAICGLAFLFAGSNFWVFGLVEILFAATIYGVFRAFVIAVLSSRP
jgi:hypothetical protein